MLKFRRLMFFILIAFAGSASAQVEPIPAPPPPEGPIVLLTSHALDGHGAELEDARIGVAAGKNPLPKLFLPLRASPRGSLIATKAGNS